MYTACLHEKHLPVYKYTDCQIVLMQMNFMVTSYHTPATNHRNYFIKVINYRYLTGTLINLRNRDRSGNLKKLGLLFFKFNCPSCHLTVLWRPVKKAYALKRPVVHPQTCYIYLFPLVPKLLYVPLKREFQLNLILSR